MKNLFLLFLSLLATNVLAQFKLPTNEAGQVQYQEIVRIGDGKLPARQVYNLIQAWGSKHYPTATEAEQQYDQQHGILFVRSLYQLGKQSIRYTLTVEARIGRYRATITDLVAEGNKLLVPIQASSSTADEMIQAAGGKAENPKVVEQVAAEQAEMYKQLDNACRATLASLKESMTSPDSGKK